MATDPNTSAAGEVHYPRAVDRHPSQAIDVVGPRRWPAMLGDWFGLIAVVWSIPLAIVLVGIPIALVLAVVLWVGRWGLDAS